MKQFCAHLLSLSLLLAAAAVAFTQQPKPQKPALPGVTEQGPEATAVRAEVDQFRQRIQALRDEIAKAIIGNKEVIDGVLTCMLAGGHALLEGVPGTMTIAPGVKSSRRWSSSAQLGSPEVWFSVRIAVIC